MEPEIVQLAPGLNGNESNLDLPDNFLVVSNNNGTIHHVFETDPEVIRAMIEEGAGTEFAVFGPNGEIEALYLGTYYVNGNEMDFIPNPQIPLDLLDLYVPTSRAQLPPLFWPLMLLALMALPFILYLLLKQRVKVYFYGEEDEKPFMLKCKKHSKLSPPDVFVREGEVISGWYKDRIQTKKWIFTDDKVTKNTRLYARWTKVD